MRHRQNLVLLLLFFWNIYSYGQDPGLIEILDLELSTELKQNKIDSLLSWKSDQASKVQLADIYHDVALHWCFANWTNTRSAQYLLDAIRHTKKAVVLKSNLDSIDTYSLKRSLFNLGLLQKFNGDIYASIESHLKLTQLEGNDDRVKAAHKELGDAYSTIGDFQKAVDHLEIGLKVIEKGGHGSLEKASMHIGLADTYSSMDHTEYWDKIDGHLQKADSILNTSSIAGIIQRSQIAQLRGNLLIESGNHEGAIPYHLEALQYFTSHSKEFSSSPNFNGNMATIHNSLGVSYDKLRQTKTAHEHFDMALSFHPEFSPPYENLGDLYLAIGEYKKGLLHYQKAIALTTDKNLEVKYEDIPSLENLELSTEKTLLLNHLVAKANGWMHFYTLKGNLGHLEQALKTFELADQLIDIIRSESTEQQSKLYWRGQSANLYMKAVEACYLLKKPERTYYFMERNKALLLLEDLTSEEAKGIAQLPSEIAEREFNLKRRIYLSENSLEEADNKNRDTIAILKDAVRKHKYEHGQFVDSLDQTYPDYAKYKKKVEILSFEEQMASYVSNKQLVLHYILNEEDGYGLLTGENGPIMFQLEDAAQLNAKIDTLTALLSSGISNVKTFKTISNTLFNNLIPEEIYSKIKGKQLIIVPDYTLQRIPFETLVVDEAKTRYLIEDTEIAYVYSMSLLDYNKGNTRNHTKQLLGLAPVNFDDLGLVELRNSKSEISGIAPFFGGEIFVEGQASKANFLKEVASPKIIHLATHADMGNGENPWIAFSDEKMYLKEIYATKNQSEMVVLSACNTLSGDLKRGEGVMSLARGFFYSGAKSVVSSLWPLTDETGSNIMISFYKNLDKGHSKSKALRQAKLDYMNSNIVEELKHPFYWAGFVIVGDNAPLVSSWNPIWIYIGIVVLVLAILYLFRRKFFKQLQ